MVELEGEEVAVIEGVGEGEGAVQLAQVELKGTENEGKQEKGIVVPFTVGEHQIHPASNSQDKQSE